MSYDGSDQRQSSRSSLYFLGVRTVGDLSVWLGSSWMRSWSSAGSAGESGVTPSLPGEQPQPDP